MNETKPYANQSAEIEVYVHRKGCSVEPVLFVVLGSKSNWRNTSH